MSRIVSQRVGSLEIRGYSLAGEESVIIAPELNVAFDFGRAPRELIPIDHVCLSHGHMDHAAGIAYYFSQRNFVGNAPGCAIMHRHLVRPVERLLRAWSEIEGHPTPARLVGLEPDQEQAIRRDLIVRAFRVAHREPSLGFAVIERRHKLKPEYAGLSGPQLVELKKKGIEIQYPVEVPRITYCGDTGPGAFLDRDDVKNAEILVLECTFYEDEHKDRARAGQHFHLHDLRDALAQLNCPYIVLTHMTRRVSLAQARQTALEVLGPEAATRIRFLMDRPRRRPAPGPPGPGDTPARG